MVVKKIDRLDEKTKASIRCENIYGYFSADNYQIRKAKNFYESKARGKLKASIYLMRPSQKYEWIKNSHFAVIKELSRT